MDNATVVDLLCNFLDFDTLKIVRELNRLWREEAAKELLLYKAIIRIPPGFHQRSLTHQQREISALENLLQPKLKTTEGQTEFLSMRRRNVMSIRISRFEDISIFQALQIFGDHVKHLEVSRDIFPANSSDREAVWQEVERLLTDHMTSIKSFTFYEYDEVNNNKLPDFFYLEDLRLFNKLEKFHLVKSLALRPTDLYPNPNNNNTNLEKVIENLEIISEHPLGLQSILLGYGNKLLEQKEPAIFIRYIECLNKILESSKDTIEKMEVADKFSGIPSFRIPILTRLNTLNVVVLSSDVYGNDRQLQDLVRIEEGQPIFPANINNQGQDEVNVFPKLQRVTIGEVSDYSMNFYFLCFKAPQIAKVQSLLPMLKPKLKTGVDDDIGQHSTFLLKIRAIAHNWRLHLANKNGENMDTMTFSNERYPIFSLSMFNHLKVEYLSHRFLVSPPDSIPFQDEKTLKKRAREVSKYQLVTCDKILLFLLSWIPFVMMFFGFLHATRNAPNTGKILYLICIANMMFNFFSSLIIYIYW